jgi:hypothetical protein
MGYLKNLTRIMQSVRERDDRIAPVSQKRLSAVRSLGWDVMTDSDIPKELKDEAERQREALIYCYRNLSATDALDLNRKGTFGVLVDGMMDALAYKWAVHELIWKPSTKGLTAEFKRVPLDWMENTTSRLRYLPSEAAIMGADLEEEGWMITCGPGIMIPCVIAYLVKRLAMASWLTYAEKHAMPGIVGKTKSQKGSDDWVAMKELVSNFSQDFAGVLAIDEVLEKIDFSAAGPLPYKELLQAADQAVTIIWRGADLSTVSSGNNQGTGASLQGEEGDLLLQNDCAEISETLQSWVDPVVIRWATGWTEKPLAYVKVSPPKSVDIVKEIATDKFLAEMGVAQSQEAILERYGRRAIGEDETPLQRPAPQPTPMEVGGFGGRNGFQRRQDGEPEQPEVEEDEESEDDLDLGNARQVAVTGAQALAAARYKTLKELDDRLAILAGITNPDLFDIEAKRLIKDLPNIAKRIGRNNPMSELMFRLMTGSMVKGAGNLLPSGGNGNGNGESRIEL